MVGPERSGAGGASSAAVAHLAAALREVAAEPGATLRYPAPGGVSHEQAFRGPPGVPLTPAHPAADPATHHLIVAPGPSPGQVDVVEQVDVVAPGKGGKELAEALLQAREKAPGALLRGGRPLRDPLATHGSSDESEAPSALRTTTTTGTGTGTASTSAASGGGVPPPQASPAAAESGDAAERADAAAETPLSPLLPGGTESSSDDVPAPPASADKLTTSVRGVTATAEPLETLRCGGGSGGSGGSGETGEQAASPSVAHLAAALREVAAEPGATLRYPAPGGLSHEQAFRGPPGVPLTPSHPAADPATHHLIVAPGPSPGQVDVVEQVDLPPLAKEDGSPVPEAAAVLEQVCEHNPAIGPKPLHDPLAEKGTSDEGEDGSGAVEEGGDTGEPSEVQPPAAVRAGAVDALTAAFAAVGLGRAAAGAKEEEGIREEEGGGDRGSSGGGGVSGKLAAVTEKLRSSAVGMTDVVRGSTGQVDQAARQLAAAVTASAALAKERILGTSTAVSGAAAKASELLGESLIGGGDVITGGCQGRRDQEDVAEDWTAGPAP